MIEQTIYARLLDVSVSSLVAGIYTSQPSVNTDYPFLVISETGAEQPVNLGSPSDLIKYSFSVDVWTRSESGERENNEIANAVRRLLSGWRGGSVMSCWFDGTNSDQQDKTFHSTSNYGLWWKDANLLMLSDHTGLITTGDGYVSLTACDNTFSVGCDGLTLNGEPIEGGYGPQGEPGTGATITVGTVTTLAPNQPASVTNVGTESEAVFDFGLPKGLTGSAGAQGLPGNDGLSAYELAVANGFAGSEAQWLNSLVGPAGSAATISVGTVTTGAAGSSASVTNVGTSSAAVFNISIPRGNVGATGTQGVSGSDGSDGLTAYEIAIAHGFTGTEAQWLNSLVGPTGSTGSTGASGPAGSAATISVGTVTTGAAGSSASVTNVGTSSAAVFDIAIPRGATGSTGSTGPNSVTTATTTTLTGYLKGNGSNVSAVTTVPNTDVTGLGSASTQNTGTFLHTANNLSDVTAATARTNLGLGTAATQSTGTFLQTANNLSEVTAATARTNLGLGTLATQSGTFSGTSSGTNTGDQTITLTGDVTGSGTGSFAATIGGNKVTAAKMAASATNVLFGRSTTGAGAGEEIVCTAAGRALIDDAAASDQRTTLGLGTLATASSVSLTTQVTGVLPVANGGTGSSSTILPAGIVWDYAGSTTPTGWLGCDGSAVSRTTYADLFTAIGTTWGTGNGTTTFNVPDLRGRTTIGSGTGSGLTTRALAGTGGEENHTLTTSEMPSHQHNHRDGAGCGLITVTGTENLGIAFISSTLNTSVNQYDKTGFTGGGTAHNTMMPYRVVTKIIKT